MGTDKRTTLTLGLRKKLENRQPQNEQSSQTTSSDKRTKLTLGLKKKPQPSQPQAESQPTAFDQHPPRSFGLRKKTVRMPPQGDGKAPMVSDRYSRFGPGPQKFGPGPQKTPEFITRSVLDGPHRPPMPREKKSTIRMPKTQGRLEINIKITELPNWVETIKHDWQRICINADGEIVQMKVRPRIWNKLVTANQNYPMWVASITGKMGPRIKDGFELLEVGVQVYEKKLKESSDSQDESQNEE